MDQQQGSGKIKITERAELTWMRGSGDGELYGSLWLDGRLFKVDGRTVSGWWRTESPEALELYVRTLYGKDIERAEREEVAS